jgi:hypothetical protein
MIYKVPDFLAVVGFGSSPIPPLPPGSPVRRPQVVSLSQSSCVSPGELTDGRRGGGSVGEEPNNTTAQNLALYKSFKTFWNLGYLHT